MHYQRLQKVISKTLWASRGGQSLLICWLFAQASLLAQEPQSPAPSAKLRQAQELLQAAAEALNKADYETTRQKSQQVAQLLPDDGRVQQRAGELTYLAGFPRESLPLFDKAIELEPDRSAHNWQRGIALATCGEFQLGAEQFKVHHLVNPDDVENSAWYFLCLAKAEGIEAARRAIIPSRGDSRPPMMSVLKMFKEQITPEKVIDDAKQVSGTTKESRQAKFYADLYVALYFDSIGRNDDAIKYLQSSLGHQTSDYMTHTARVYLAHRFKVAD